MKKQLGQSLTNKQTNKQTYDTIVSLGFFCSVATENERIGYRSFSLPFDWLITNKFSTVIRLLNTGFCDFLLCENLRQEKEVSLKYYYDIKNEIHFYHDFNDAQSLAEQMDAVQDKYRRRINRLYETIERPTLFVRYCSRDDIAYIQNNYDEILKCIRSFNDKNHIVFVCDEQDIAFPNQAIVFYVKKDRGDTVARHYLKKNKAFHQYIKEHVWIGKKEKRKNICIYWKKQKEKVFLKIKTLLKNKF